MGSSPNAPELLTLAESLLDVSQSSSRNGWSTVTITTNRGLKLMPTPDYYVCFCRIAEKMFRHLYKPAQAAGTKIVCGNYKLPVKTIDHPIINVVNEKPPRITPRQAKKNMAQVDPCDVTFNVGPWYKDAQPWKPGVPFMGRASGLRLI